MRIDLARFATEYANLERDEATTDTLYAVARGWQGQLRRSLQAAGLKVLQDPQRAENHELFSILTAAQHAVGEEIRALQARQQQHVQIRALINTLVANVGLTVADLEQGEHGHA